MEAAALSQAARNRTRGLLAALGLVIVATLAAAAPAPGQDGMTVDFAFAPVAPKVGEVTTFTSTSSSAAAIVRESWDFTSDGQIDGTGNSVTAAFVDPGNYNVTLEVEDAAGQVKRLSKLLTVARAVTAPAAKPPTPAKPLAATVKSPPPLVAPFPNIRIAGSVSPAGIRLSLFRVTALAGMKITVRCSGRGCPYRERGPLTVRTAGTRPAGAARVVYIAGFADAVLQPGVRIQVFVAHPTKTGKYTRFTIRRGAPQRADRCLRPSGSIGRCQRQTA
jgi:plastocyanin